MYPTWNDLWPASIAIEIGPTLSSAFWRPVSLPLGISVCDLVPATASLASYLQYNESCKKRRLIMSELRHFVIFYLSFVRIHFLRFISFNSCKISESIVHQSPLAAMVAKFGCIEEYNIIYMHHIMYMCLITWAIHELLFWEWYKSSSFLEMLSLKRTSCWKRPARTTSTLWGACRWYIHYLRIIVGYFEFTWFLTSVTYPFFLQSTVAAAGSVVFRWSAGLLYEESRGRRPLYILLNSTSPCKNIRKNFKQVPCKWNGNSSPNLQTRSSPVWIQMFWHSHCGCQRRPC